MSKLHELVPEMSRHLKSHQNREQHRQWHERMCVEVERKLMDLPPAIAKAVWEEKSSLTADTFHSLGQHSAFGFSYPTLKDWLFAKRVQLDWLALHARMLYDRLQERGWEPTLSAIYRRRSGGSELYTDLIISWTPENLRERLDNWAGYYDTRMDELQRTFDRNQEGFEREIDGIIAELPEKVAKAFDAGRNYEHLSRIYPRSQRINRAMINQRTDGKADRESLNRHAARLYDYCRDHGLQPRLTSVGNNGCCELVIQWNRAHLETLLHSA